MASHTKWQIWLLMVKNGENWLWFSKFAKIVQKWPIFGLFFKKNHFRTARRLAAVLNQGRAVHNFFPEPFSQLGGGVNTPNFARRIFFAIYVFSTHRFSIKWLPIVVCPQFENVDLEAQLCKSTGGILCSGNTTCICQCPIPTATRPGPEGHSLSGILQLQVLSNSSKLLV